MNVVENGFLSFMGGRSLRVLESIHAVVVILLVPMILVVLFNFTVSARIGGLGITMITPGHARNMGRMRSELSGGPCFALINCVSGDRAS